MRKLFLFLSFVLLSLFSFSQIPDSIFERFGDEFTPEKSYLHFDKAGYAPGETIWFKAYLLSGTLPEVNSKNFYVDWYDEKGDLIKHIVTPIVVSTARNQFEIPADYKGTQLTVKAYTRWMLNFDTSFIFSKAIPVLQKNVRSKTETSITKIDFLPEGGNLIAGIESRIAFKAVNQNGDPVTVNGTIVSSTGKTVAQFNSVHDGMGSFILKPEKGISYTAQWTNQYREKGTQALPIPLSSGIVLTAEPQVNDVRFTLQRLPEEADAFGSVYMVGTMHGQRVYQARVNLSKLEKTSALIPVDMLPDGVMLLTVFNKSWQPVAERPVFIKRGASLFDADVKGKFNTAKRGRNELEINLIDTLSGTFSVAITDAEVFSDTSTNIVSHLLLSADIKGKIKNPAFYFRNDDDSTRRFLDLVMLTNGWRKIMWQDLTAGRLPRLWFPPETTYMEFGGKVFGATPSELMNDALNLIVQTKDSTKQFFQAEIRKDGTFSLPQLVFYDTMKVYYQFNKKVSLGAKTSTKFNNGFRAELYKRLLAETNIVEAIPSDLAARMQRYADQQAALEKLLKGTTLEAVTVTTKKKDPLDVMDDKYTSGMFSSDNGYRFNLADDPTASAAMDIFSYLQGKVPGLQIRRGGADVSLTWRNSPTTLFLNEFQTDASQLSSISMADVAYIKVFRPPFFGATGGGAGGAVSVYLKKDGEARNNTAGRGLEFQYVAGYTPVRQFYSPDYTNESNTDIADLRSTIYWNPDVIFNRQNTQVILKFFNNDNAKKFRVIIEGMDEEGKLFHYTRIIQ